MTKCKECERKDALIQEILKRFQKSLDYYASFDDIEAYQKFIDMHKDPR